MVSTATKDNFKAEVLDHKGLAFVDFYAHSLDKLVDKESGCYEY